MLKRSRGSEPRYAPTSMGPRHAHSRWLARLAAVLFVGALAWHGLRPLGDLDVWWHMRLGERLLAGPVPTDVFSHTHPDSAWPWKDAGSAILLFGLHALGGLTALVLFKFALLAIAASFCWHTLASIREVPPALALAGIALAIDAASFRFTERAATLSLVILAVVLWLIERHRRGASGLVWVIPLTILNANLHRGVLVLPVVMGALAAVELFEAKVQGHTRAWTRTLLIAIGTGAAILITPYTTAIVTTTVALMGQHSALITEWAPVTPELVWHLTPTSFAMIGLAGLGAMVALLARPRDPWDAVLALMALGLGLGSMRHLPYLALMGIGPAASALARARSIWEGRLCGLIMVSTGALALLAQVARPLPGPSFGVAPAHFPERGVEWIEALPSEHRLRGQPFNEFGYGGWMIWHLWPEHRVFIDGRTDLIYPASFVQTYLRALHDPRAFARAVEDYDLEWALLDYAPHDRGRLHFDANPDWVLVYASRRALVYVRASGPNAALARERGYRWLWPHALEPSLAKAAASGHGPEALAELRRMLEEDPDNLYAAAALAGFLKRVPRSSTRD